MADYALTLENTRDGDAKAITTRDFDEMSNFDIEYFFIENVFSMIKYFLRK